MQASAIAAVACISLGLYKPAAGSMRAVLETALYYSYFRSHPQELSTLVRDKNYYEDKKSILEFHKVHTDGFAIKQKSTSLCGNIDLWYSEVSAIIHGQLPGTWTISDLEKTCHVTVTADNAVSKLENAASLINLLFLLSSGAQLWPALTPESKKAFLKGLSGKSKEAIGLPVS